MPSSSDIEISPRLIDEMAREGHWYHLSRVRDYINEAAKNAA
jgi:hypothetical protein